MVKRAVAAGVVAAFLLAGSARGQYGGGTGEPNDPYQIWTAEQMNAIGLLPHDWDKHFELKADIDLGRYRDTEFNLIGTSSIRFTGVFDGKHHTISNLTRTSTGETTGVGLFRYVRQQAGNQQSGIIANLRLVDPNVSASSTMPIGGLVGYLSTGKIVNCLVKGGAITGDGYVGGLAGYVERFGVIERSAVSGTIMTGSSPGGLLGSNTGTLRDSYGAATVRGLLWAGGLVASNVPGRGGAGSLVNCYSTGKVESEQNAGGLVGMAGYVSNCFWDVEASPGAPGEAGVGGEGKTTAEMQTAATFLEAGWDFLGETLNGTEDVWWIDDGNDYPRLWWETPRYSGGTGAPDDPYQIATADDLIALAASGDDYDRCFILTGDIDLGGYEGTDFCLIDGDFTGVFDGNDRTISNLRGPLFSRIGAGLGRDGVVNDIGLVDPNIVLPLEDWIGALARRTSGGKIDRCYVRGGRILGQLGVGGLVGLCEDDSAITNSHADSIVGGYYYMGGLVGSLRAGTEMAACRAAGTVSGGHYAGGLVGCNGGTILNSYASAHVSVYRNAGGLVGENGDGPSGMARVVNCYSTGPVHADIEAAGLIGYNHAETLSSFWDIETSGQTASPAGEGRTTAQMQTGDTFIVAGWDLIGEADNGTEDIWWVLEGQDYPRLWWELVGQ